MDYWSNAEIMTQSREFDTVWEDIYQRGEQLNLYPYDSIVAFMMRRFARRLSTETIRVLEIGCGAGNNLWFAARQGFVVSGLDASDSAIAFAKERFAKDQLKGEFKVGSFTDLPWEAAEFDVVLDRAASTNVGIEIARGVVAEVGRVLKPGGVFYSEVFSDQASSRGDKLEDGVLANIRGPYANAGQIYFYSKSELEDMYQADWELKELSHTERKDYLQESIEIAAHWSLVAMKPLSA